MRKMLGYRDLLLAIMLVAAVFCGVLGAPTQHAHAQSQASAVSGIIVEGNKRIENDTIRSYLAFTPGQQVTSAQINQGVKTLFETGLFSDVRINRRGNSIVVSVVENPIINRVTFEGNKEVKTKTLRKEIQANSRIVFTKSKINEDVQRLRALYRRSGRFSARISPKIIRLTQNRVNVVYEISEGPETRIERINFIGNRAFSDGQLRGVITTSESRWWKLFSSGDNYDPDRLNFDRELLRRHYLKNGYADFRVVSAVAELTQDGSAFFITITVNEGDQYKFGTSEVVSSLSEMNSPAALDAIVSIQGEKYDTSKIDKSVDNLQLIAGQKGYAFARVKPRVKKNAEELTIDLKYTVSEGPRVYIERIEIIGNLRTQDNVIRRELRLVEGDAYNRFLADKGRRRIVALDYFKTVKLTRRQGSASDRVILTVQVEEKSTGSLSVGAGFSTSESLLGNVTLTERNFLGRGQRLKLSTALSFKRQRVDFSFTEPYFLERNMSFGVDLFATETDFQDEGSYDIRRLGAGVRLGFPLAENTRLTTRYNLSHQRISDIDTSASQAVQRAEKTRLISRAGYTLTYNTLDNPLDPTTGIRLSFDQDVAGLGGDAFYVSTAAKAHAYHSFTDGIVARLGGTAGHIFGFNGKDVHILDRFHTKIRGFERGGIGPRDTTTDDALGGETYATASADLMFPIGLPDEWGIKGALFTEAGTLFGADRDGAATFVDDESIRAAAGFGLLWNSPFGPARLDFVYPFLKESFDKEEYISFSFGTRF